MTVGTTALPVSQRPDCAGGSSRVGDRSPGHQFTRSGSPRPLTPAPRPRGFAASFDTRARILYDFHSLSGGKANGGIGNRRLVLSSFRILWARMSMVDGFPYKEEVSGSSPFVPTKSLSSES